MGQRGQGGLAWGRRTYSDLKIDHLVRESRDGIIEAEAVLADFVGGEDEVALPLFLPVEDHALFAGFFRGPVDCVVDWKMPTSAHTLFISTAGSAHTVE